MPGSGQVTDAAKEAPGKAQEGAGMAGYYALARICPHG